MYTFLEMTTLSTTSLADIISMVEKDPSMKEIAQADLDIITEQKKNTENQIKVIVDSEKEEIEYVPIKSL